MKSGCHFRGDMREWFLENDGELTNEESAIFWLAPLSIELIDDLYWSM